MLFAAESPAVGHCDPYVTRVSSAAGRRLSYELMQLAEHDSDLERARLEAWRLRQLIEVGYAQHRAEQLVKAEVDWHLACWLLANGCDQKTALRILL